MKSLVILLFSLTVTDLKAGDGNLCAAMFRNNPPVPSKIHKPAKSTKLPVVAKAKPVKKQKIYAPETWTQETAWKESQATLAEIQKMVKGKDNVIHGLVTAMLAKEFVWLNGDPGGAKTFVSRILFQAQLNAIADKDKKVFVLQFHKLMSEGIITGFPKIKSLLDNGRYELETSSSLVGDKFLFLIADEAEKSNPATMTALLSVLNERKAFLGSRIVDAALSSGVFTSNKNTAEFLQGGKENRPGLEALLDRMGIKIHVPNMQASPADFIKMYDSLKSGSTASLKELQLPIHVLQSLVSKVEIPTPMIDELAKLVQKMDELTTAQSDNSLDLIRSGDRAAQEYFPANQFSNRSVLKLLNIMKASFIADQILKGKEIQDIQLKMTQKDLYHVARSAIYGGPSQLRLRHFDLNEISISEEFSKYVYQVEAEWNPYDKSISFYHKHSGEKITLNIEKDTQSIEKEDIGIEITPAQLKVIREKIEKVENENNFDPETIVYEADKEISKLIGNRALPSKTRQELTNILNDTNSLAQQLNAIQKSDSEQSNTKLVKLKKDISSFKAKQKVWDEYLKTVVTSKTMTQEKKLEAYYRGVQYALKSLKISFPEMEHSIMAHMVAILAHQHVYAFGPPGGAKTALAKQIISSVLEWEQTKNAGYTAKQMDRFMRKFGADLRVRSPEAYEMFFLQFHPMVPEGSIVGFPKLQTQIDSGKLEMDYSTSLAHKKFIFTILDEVEKGNPAVLTSLLSVLNEREIFIGQDVLKTQLRTAVLTSNKMPSEFLDSFLEDRATGNAIMDRPINKAYIPNKFSNVQTLAQFMLQNEAGLRSELSMRLPLSELKPLTDKVEFAEYTKIAAAQIINDFTAKRLHEEEKSRMLHEEDYMTYPDYYVKATQGSDRSGIQYFDQLKAHFIMDQINSGVKFSELRFEIEISDLHLLIGGIGYWGPYKISRNYNSDGILSFVLNDTAIDKMANGSSYINKRNQYVLKQIQAEAKEFVDSINSEVYDIIKTNRELIAQAPHLFPTLFASTKEREEFLKKNAPINQNSSQNSGN